MPKIRFQPSKRRTLHHYILAKKAQQRTNERPLLSFLSKKASVKRLPQFEDVEDDFEKDIVWHKNKLCMCQVMAEETKRNQMT